MDRRGFSLIELLVGLVIFSIGLLAIASMQTASVKGNYFSHYLMQASYVAQDRLEFLNILPLDSAALEVGEHNDGTISIGGVVFNRSYSVAASGGQKAITYSVRWNDGLNHNISFSTIRSQ